MTILNPLRGSDGEIRRVRSISSEINKRLSALDSSGDDDDDDDDDAAAAAAIAKLSTEEMQDLNKLAGIADFLLCKYANKKDAYSIFKEFASIVAKTADSLEQIDDEISELMLSADDSVGRITDMRTRISGGSDFDPKYGYGPDYTNEETSLTLAAEPERVSEPAKRVELI